MNWVRHGGSTTFETKSSYCCVVRQGLPCYTAVARLGFKRRATAVLKSNLIRSIEFGTAVARRLKRASSANEHSFDVWFLFQIWNTHSLWFWKTNDPPWSAYYSGYGISGTNPLNERIFNEIATMIVQKRTRKCTRKYRDFWCLR